MGSFAAVTVIGAAGAGPWAGVGFAAVFILITGLYQLVRGRSWLSALVPGTQRTGMGLFAGGLVVLFVAAAASPAPAPATAPADPIASPSIATSPSLVATPFASPSSTSPVSPPSPSLVPSSLTPSTPSATNPQLAVAVLGTLPIKGRAPRTGYDRGLFGQRWADVDRNGCDTRNDILGRDLSQTVTKPGTRDCVILTGSLQDPYTDTTINFVRGQDTSSEVHVDHVVALSDAWQKGAQQLDDATRTLLANDPLNLLAVQGTANMQKGDGDAATWLPPNRAFRCDYVARQVAVKARYTLWVTQAEHDAILRLLSACPTQEIPAASATTPTPSTPPSPPPPVEPLTPDDGTTAPPPPPREPEPDVFYRNCTAAREAGAAPLLRGEPGYRSAMDGDDDGVACE